MNDTFIEDGLNREQTHNILKTKLTEKKDKCQKSQANLNDLKKIVASLELRRRSVTQENSRIDHELRLCETYKQDKVMEFKTIDEAIQKANKQIKS
eukprot:CAMPEP_0185763724 /NCGR_PEP_ID=MMETSP1174-20130828/22636_1 /TAXON_ID=35687 /ORGANISM="Dictyocha speculum, Strain CCMP1381" /LENGTH=95 /DNA_ID=CAMNT_0028445947 /DNA_START=45 /DNA_END=329 /DNA_ORIENTATION=+